MGSVVALFESQNSSIEVIEIESDSTKVVREIESNQRVYSSTEKRVVLDDYRISLLISESHSQPF